MMMPLLRFVIIAVIFGVVTSQNHDMNLQTPYSGMTSRRSVEATTPLPPDSQFENEGIPFLIARLVTLGAEKLENLIKDTNRRLESLENREYLSTSPVVEKIQNLETNIENLGKNIKELVDANRNLSSSFINVTRSLVDLSSSNSELKQIFNEGFQEINDLQIEIITSCAINFTLNNKYPRNCREVTESEETYSGIYIIQPEGAPEPLKVVCDLETRGGGWTVIQRRFDGSQEFYLEWQDYRNGFGNLEGEFWLGLENIYLLTGLEANELLIELGDFEFQNKSAFYSQFSIGSEINGYNLKVLDGYSGDAGDSLYYHTGMWFTTQDNDQDDSLPVNCARYHRGAWWYLGCAFSNLNGQYSYPGQAPVSSMSAVFWYDFKTNYESLKHTRMLVRPKV